MEARVGAVILIRRKDGECLLQLRDNKPGLRNPNIWVPPGGHAEPSESMIECARREFYEETGYWCAHLNLLSEFMDKMSGWPPYHLSVYWAIYDELQLISCHEGQALEFVARKNAELLKVPPYLVELWDLALEKINGMKE